MAEEIKYKINADVSELVSQLNKLNKALDKTGDEAKTANKSLGNVEKATEKTAKSTSTLGGLLKGGLGIGIAVKAFDALTNALGESQAVQDLMNQASVVFQGLIKGIIDVLKPLFEWLGKVFKDPVKYIQEFGDMLQQNIINRLNGMLELFPKLAESIQLLFSGEFKKAGQVALDAVGKVVLGVNNTTDKIGQAMDYVADAVEHVAKTTKKAFDNKEFLANAEHNINKLGILYQGIVEKYDLMAEKQRQLRDDETKTIDDRIKSNKELSAILDEGEQKERANIEARIGIIQKQQGLLGATKERELEILSLQQEISGVSAKYAGLRSEQLMNEMSLNKEALEIEKARRESIITQTELTNEAILAEKQASVDRTNLIKNETEKLIEAKKAEEDLRKTEIEQLIQLRDLRIKEFDEQLSQLTQGTAAYQEALNAKNEFLAESTSKEKSLQKGLETFTIQSEDAIAKAKKASLQAGIDATSQALGSIVSLVGAESKWGKALAVTQAIIDTYSGASKALAQGGIVGPIAAAGVIASGLANIRSITSTKLPEPPSGMGGGGYSEPSVTQPHSFGPSVGIIGGQLNNSTQLAQAFGGIMQKPIRAYAVGQDMTSQQSLDRHINQNATLGG